jgi:hypothetical protein
MASRRLISPRTEKVRILKRPKHKISRLDIDPDALKIIYRLNSQGFVAYLTGGAVQNLMQGITPKDFDLGQTGPDQEALPERVYHREALPAGPHPFQGREVHRGRHLPQGAGC